MKLLIFTYAPAGLGHLRVTDALVDSRPKKYPYIMLGSYDKFITNIHRFTSTNPIAKWIFTTLQYGFLEDIFTVIYRWVLIKSSGQIYEQFKEIVAKQKGVDEILVVATHFGMAHQIGEVKERLMKETGIKIRLVVQVTDDTSQHIWCIKGTDLTFVPSNDTKNELETYAKKKKMNLKFSVVPYPICPTLTKSISPGSEKRQATFESVDMPINVAIPISGAAVGQTFIANLIKMMLTKSSRFHFWVLVRKAVYTEMFLSKLSKLPHVRLITGKNDNEMISLYELLYQENLMHLEITKPSEQSFKAILSPDLIGGSLLLFTSPVGRQEYENVEFLKRQGLMLGTKKLIPRAIRLSDDPKLASDFIMWGVDSGLFSRMSSGKYKFSDENLKSGEVGPDGAYKFWEVVEKEFA
ncbi:MAG: hypothetical protein WA052_03650 [Microgenomates group bacterium]